MSPTGPFDAAVVGSGPNGLAAAISLARAGRSVVVYESAETPGGGSRSAELTLPGFRHDRCAAILPMAIGSPFFRSLELEQHGLAWVHPEIPLAHPFDDTPAARLERSVEDTAADLGPDASAYLQLMRPFVLRWEELFAQALGPLSLPAQPLLMARFARHALRSAHGLAKAQFSGHRAQALLAGLGAHSVLPLEQIPSAAIGLMLGVAGHSVGWPMLRGGSQSLSSALLAELEALGGQLRTGVCIERLEDVETAGPVLFETSPRCLARICAEHLPSGFLSRLKRYRYGPGVYKIDYALRGPIPWKDPACARAGTVHLGGELEAIAASERAAWEGQHAEEPFVLIAQQSLFDTSRAPEGQHTGWAYCHVPNGSTRDMREAIESQIERYAPGFRDQVLARHCTHSAQMEAYNPNYVGGDVNVGAPSLGQLFSRPAPGPVPYSTPNPRIFLCSAATPPGGGIHGMCGFHAARAALARWPD